VHRLLGVKPIENLTKYEWIAFSFYLIFWTTFAPLVLFLQSLLQIVKGIEMLLQEAFLRFRISPPVSNAFPFIK
jgi:hypothetical protein